MRLGSVWGRDAREEHCHHVVRGAVSLRTPQLPVKNLGGYGAVAALEKTADTSSPSICTLTRKEPVNEMDNHELQNTNMFTADGLKENRGKLGKSAPELGGCLDRLWPQNPNQLQVAET
uniref:Uncharacterized protein n=1 Tax=Eutreptiella gymnastica TaxID=73025 RepID=A0A6T1YU61_9EUGL